MQNLSTVQFHALPWKYVAEVFTFVGYHRNAITSRCIETEVSRILFCERFPKEGLQKMTEPKGKDVV
jgi:hypothetical protein